MFPSRDITLCDILSGQSLAVTRQGHFSLSFEHLMLHLVNHMLLSFLDVAIVIIIACYETFSSLPALAGSLVVCDTVKYVIVPLLSTFTSFGHRYCLCIRGLPHPKFELSNQDSAGEKNFAVFKTLKSATHS